MSRKIATFAAVPSVLLLGFGWFSIFGHDDPSLPQASATHVPPVPVAAANTHAGASKIGGAAGDSHAHAAANASQQSDPDYVRTALIEFPGQAPVEVTLTRFQLLPSSVPRADTLIERMTGLVEAATAGEAAAARELFKSLDYCEAAYFDVRELDSAIRKLRDKGILEYPDGVRPSERFPPGIDFSGTVASMKEAFAYCKGLSEEVRFDAPKWSHRAAELGDILGLRYWTRQTGYSPETLRLWHQAWGTGFVGAAQALAYHYHAGIPETQYGEPDPVRAYAYHLVRAKLKEESYAKLDASMMWSIDRALKARSAELDPQEQAAAETMAFEILSANGNCCQVGMLVP